MRRSNIKKAGAAALILAVTAVLIFGIAPFTLAWLLDADSAENSFTPGAVTLQINESFNGMTKSNVTFTNTGNTPAFIRAALVPVWRDTFGNNSGLETDGTYNLTPGSGWTLSGGYYYYGSAVPAGGTTSALIVSCSPDVDLIAHPEYAGMSFEMQVIASALQADGWNAATDTAIEAFAAATDNSNKEF